MTAPSHQFDYRVSSQAFPVAINSFPVRSVTISHRKVGGEDVAVLRGTTPIAFLRKTAASAGLFLSINATDTVVSKTIYMNPFAGSEALGLFPSASLEWNTALGYNRYRFTKVDLTTVSRVSTSTAGSSIIAYYPDGVINDADVVNGLLYACPVAVSSPIWSSTTASVTPYLPRDWYYLDNDTDGGDAGDRQTLQGAIIGEWDSTPTDGVYYGYLWMSYELELKDPSGNQDLALRQSNWAKRMAEKKRKPSRRGPPRDLKPEKLQPVDSKQVVPVEERKVSDDDRDDLVSREEAMPPPKTPLPPQPPLSDRVSGPPARWFGNVR
jgi:hypothetical protein